MSLKSVSRFSGRSIPAIALLLVAGLGTSSASAQVRIQVLPVKGGAVQIRSSAGYFSRNNLYTLRIQQVQQELKLDDDQKSEVLEAITELTKGRKDAYAKARKLQGAERTKAFRGLQKKFAEDGNKKTKEILDPKQLARLKQITLWLSGIRVLQDPKVQKELKLDEDQTKEIAQVQKDANEKRQKEFKKLRGAGKKFDIKKYRELSTKIMAEIEKNTMAVLTKSQRDQLTKMRGKKFEMKRGRVGILPIRANGIKLKLRKAKVRPIKRKKAQQKKNDK